VPHARGVSSWREKLEFLIFAAFISLPYLLGWAFLAFLRSWRSLTTAILIWSILVWFFTAGEGYPDGGPIGGIFAIIALFVTGLFAGAVSAGLSILSRRKPTARVRTIYIRLGCAAGIYLLYATWKSFHELVSRIAIG
jgi:hypothetical protein